MAEKKKYTPTTKAYRNDEFLASDDARLIRIICEYEETQRRLRHNDIRATILVFGSARAKNQAQWDQAMEEAKAQMAEAEGEGQDSEAYKKAKRNLTRVEKTAWMGEMHDKIGELSRLLTEWAVSPECTIGGDHTISGVTRYHSANLSKFQSIKVSKNQSMTALDQLGNNAEVPIKRSSSSSSSEEEVEVQQGIYICTGGGPGFMEAANRGADKVAGAKNIGMGISLPFEDGLNEHVTNSLAFSFHYFFTRKFWMVYHCQALIVAPGGFGTLDELFEVLTLKQTGKIQKDLPVVLFGKAYWDQILNWQAMVDFGTVAQEDVDALFTTDSAEDAAEYLKQQLSNNNDHANQKDT